MRLFPCKQNKEAKKQTKIALIRRKHVLEKNQGKWKFYKGNFIKEDMGIYKQTEN